MFARLPSNPAINLSEASHRCILPYGRSYRDIVLDSVIRLSLQNPEMQIEQYGMVCRKGESYPLIRAMAGSPWAPRVVITAGVHGDEPAGVFAAIQFLRERIVPLSRSFAIEVYPCINPAGFEANSRHCSGSVDLNRRFSERSRQPEVRAFLDAFDRTRTPCEMVIDLHQCISHSEDETGEEYERAYLYNSAPRGDTVAKKMIAAIPKRNVYRSPEMDGLPCRDGIIETYDVGRSNEYGRRSDLEQFLYHSGRSNRCITLETPGEWPVRRSISVFLRAIDAGLYELRRQQSSDRLFHRGLIIRR